MSEWLDRNKSGIAMTVLLVVVFYGGLALLGAERSRPPSYMAPEHDRCADLGPQIELLKVRADDLDKATRRLKDSADVMDRTNDRLVEAEEKLHQDQTGNGSR